ncbi:hypothetical protein ABP2_0135 [Bacillus subtilis subsp. subtilis]|nr:hypothetical protein [Bacillus subtilis subsp. subtilis]
MAYKKKDDIKINKKHGGKEFTNNFRFVGLVKPVRKKIQKQTVGMMPKFLKQLLHKQRKTEGCFSLISKLHLIMN